jgi:hypothetical protein
MDNWPKPGDSLFSYGEDWESEAILGGPPWDRFLRYAQSYKQAADAVIDSVEDKRTHPDVVGYAVCFLYRHYVELMLKALIAAGMSLEERRAEYPRNEHHIDHLWALCRPLLEKACPESDEAETDGVEACMKELAQNDPSGQVFRYGEDSQGQPTLAKPIQFNLGNMRRVMNRLSGFLEGSYDYLHELVQIQADIDSEGY